jgi:hypothetical protein
MYLWIDESCDGTPPIANDPSTQDRPLWTIDCVPTLSPLTLCGEGACCMNAPSSRRILLV